MVRCQFHHSNLVTHYTGAKCYYRQGTLLCSEHRLTNAVSIGTGQDTDDCNAT